MAGLAQAKRCCVYVKPEKVMHCISPELFDCCADPVVHLLLLKSSMQGAFIGRFICSSIPDISNLYLLYSKDEHK